jgi:putative hydrolase of the HAD superfamily
MPAPRAGMLDGVRWVLFDAVGTLIDAQPPVAEAYFAAARQYGSSLSVAEIRKRFAAALRAEQGADSTRLDRPLTDEAQECERWRRIVAAVIDDAVNGDALFEQLWEHFAHPEHWRPYDDVCPALNALAQGGFRLGIASNFDARLQRIISGRIELHSIEHVFVSSEVGHIKPDPRFFAKIQERLGARPSEIMLVGDDEVNDLAGASAAGWRHVLLDRDGTCQISGAIRSLAELTPAGETPAPV